MRGCDDLGYNHFGIYNQQECICGNGAPATTNRADQVIPTPRKGAF